MGLLRKVCRRRPAGGVLVKNPFQQRWQRFVRATVVRCAVGQCPIVRVVVVRPAVGFDGRAASVGIGYPVQRIEGCQNGSALRVDKIDSTKIPACITHDHATEMTDS